MNLRDAAQAEKLLRLLELAEVEMHYAGWADKQADNPGRLEVYQKVVFAAYNLRCEARFPTPAADKASDLNYQPTDLERAAELSFVQMWSAYLDKKAEVETLKEEIAALRAKNAKPAEQTAQPAEGNP